MFSASSFNDFSSSSTVYPGISSAFSVTVVAIVWSFTTLSSAIDFPDSSTYFTVYSIFVFGVYVTVSVTSAAGIVPSTVALSTVYPAITGLSTL